MSRRNTVIACTEDVSPTVIDCVDARAGRIGSMRSVSTVPDLPAQSAAGRPDSVAQGDGQAAGFIASVVGAIILLAIYRMVLGRKSIAAANTR